MKAGLATIALRQLDVLEAIDLAAAAGFDGVEIWGRAPHTPDEFDEKHTLAIRDRAREKGIRTDIFGSYVNSAAPDFKAKAETALRIARILESPIIRVWAGDKEPPSAIEDDWVNNAANLAWMARKAGDHGIQLAMEMHGGTLALTPEGTMRLIESAGVDNLKLNYQVNNTAEPDLERSVGIVGPHVAMVHAQNAARTAPGSEREWERSLIEDGAVDYLHLLRLLKPYGFDGYIEVEFLKGDGDIDLMKESLLKDGAYLKKIAAEA